VGGEVGGTIGRGKGERPARLGEGLRGLGGPDAIYLRGPEAPELETGFRETRLPNICISSSIRESLFAF
jgi:hypothetical protein